MKKNWILIIVIAGVLLLAGIAVLFILRCRNMHLLEPMDGPGMIYEVVVDELEYVKNDHISGGIYRITAERGAKIRLEMELKESSDSESVITIAEADRELFDQIGTIILRAGLEHAGNYPERDPYQMPDTTSHLKVVEPYKTFSITSLMDLNESELQALSEIVALLEEAFH